MPLFFPDSSPSWTRFPLPRGIDLPDHIRRPDVDRVVDPEQRIHGRRFHVPLELADERDVNRPARNESSSWVIPAVPSAFRSSWPIMGRKLAPKQV